MIAIWLIGMNPLTVNTGQNSLKDQNVRFCADIRFGIQNLEKWCKDDRFSKAKMEIQNQNESFIIEIILFNVNEPNHLTLRN